MVMTLPKGVQSLIVWDDIRSGFRGGKREGALGPVVLLGICKAAGGSSRIPGAIGIGQVVTEFQDVRLQVLSAQTSSQLNCCDDSGRGDGSTYEVNSTRTRARAQYCQQARLEFCDVSIDSTVLIELFRRIVTHGDLRMRRHSPFPLTLHLTPYRSRSRRRRQQLPSLVG